MVARVAHYIRHWRLLPTLVDAGMALFTGLRANIVRRDSFSFGLSTIADMAQVANEKHQFPAIVGRLFMGVTQGGHSGEADTVLNDVVNFPVCKVLRRTSAEVG